MSAWRLTPRCGSGLSAENLLFISHMCDSCVYVLLYDLFFVLRILLKFTIGFYNFEKMYLLSEKHTNLKISLEHAAASKNLASLTTFFFDKVTTIYGNTEWGQLVNKWKLND